MNKQNFLHLTASISSETLQDRLRIEATLKRTETQFFHKNVRAWRNRTEKVSFNFFLLKVILEAAELWHKSFQE